MHFYGEGKREGVNIQEPCLLSSGLSPARTRSPAPLAPVSVGGGESQRASGAVVRESRTQNTTQQVAKKCFLRFPHLFPLHTAPPRYFLIRPRTWCITASEFGSCDIVSSSLTTHHPRHQRVGDTSASELHPPLFFFCNRKLFPLLLPS